MTAVTKKSGVALSSIVERKKGVRTRPGPQSHDRDLELAAEIRCPVDERPICGYRRTAVLLRRERTGDATMVNRKRVYRPMKKQGLLLARHAGRVASKPMMARQ